MHVQGAEGPIGAEPVGLWGLRWSGALTSGRTLAGEGLLTDHDVRNEWDRPGK